MKIGVKTYCDKEYIEHFTNKTDFIEVIGISKEDFLKNKKIIVHCKHERFKINLANKLKEKENIEAIQTAIEIADFCNSDRIIVHPGFIENESCSLKNSINLMKKFKDKRIITETMPGNYKNKNFLCSTPEELKEYIQKTNISGFCLDINHTISSATSQNKNPYEYLKEFIKLNPKQIHLGGQKLPEDITHIPFSRSNIDLKKALEFLHEDSEIILEVTQDITETEKDLEIVRKTWANRIN
ncbi:Xylose isomerase-like TIM barrel [uncultured archaeon]|nr:Xylose isomerase-like TIM barrel [uncultured archaeon]